MEGVERPVGLAIIGAGLMGSQHAASASACAAVDLVGVHAADADQARALAERHGVEVFGTLEDVLADDRIEAVLVATPTSSHAQVAHLAIAAGRHAFVEKPVTRSLEDALALRAAARAGDVVVGVGHVIRYFPEYREIHDAIERGDIGTPAVATFGRRCQQPDWAPDHWHTDMARSGGVAVDMLVHDVDLVRWCFGEPTEVYARVVGSDRHGGLDYALATLTVPDGPICHLHGSWAEPDGFSQSAEVCGSAGMITYDSRGTDELQLATHAGSNTATALPPPPPGDRDPFQRQLADFARAIRTGVAMPGDLDWAIGSLRVALAMLESSDRRDVVTLGPLEDVLAQDGTSELRTGGRA
ncbi:MAG: oxidoreductase domain protein [Thermoleophilia bacterium]|nr:oxidoreductase domain protein [Thermoleophilia bacterium]